MKRVTMELGGHATAIVFDDDDIDLAEKTLAAAKFRNAGQVCVSPTRFLVQEAMYEPFVAKFVANPATAPGVLLRVPQGLMRLRRIAKRATDNPVLPKEIMAREMKGMVMGPYLYWKGRRRLRSLAAPKA